MSIEETVKDAWTLGLIFAPYVLWGGAYLACNFNYDFKKRGMKE